MKFLKNWKIETGKVPAYTAFKKQFTIDVDYKLLQMMSEVKDKEITEDRLKLLRPLLQAIDKKLNKIKLTYYHPYSLGRFYATNSLSPINVSRHFKHSLFSYMDWIDLDMVRGHASIIYSIAKNNNIHLKTFEKYLTNRDAVVAEMLQHYQSDPPTLAEKDIKDIFNISIYGGGHSTWVKQMAEDGKEVGTSEIHDFEKEFVNECRTIMDYVYISNSEILDKVRGEEKNEYKLKCKVMAYFCGTIENEILHIAYKFLCERGIIQNDLVLLEYDGLCFPNPHVENLDEIINELNFIIRDKTKLNVRMINKKYDPEYVHQDIIEQRKLLDLPVANLVGEAVNAIGVAEVDENDIDNEQNFDLYGLIKDDNEGANLIYENIKDRFKFCYGNMFFKQNVVWVSSKEKVDKHLLNFILTKTDLRQMSRGKNPTPYPYSTNVSGARALQSALYAKLVIEGEDNTLLTKFITTTRGRLCFLDGVLDMTEKDGFRQGKFYRFDENGNVPFEYYTPVQIARKFGDYFDKPNYLMCSHVEKEVFMKLFGAECKKALKFLSRGVAGHFEDKAWSLYMGNRNCGKGVVDLLAGTAIGEYKSNVEAQNLLCNSNRTLKQEQPEKQMAFALDFQFSRLCFSQELPAPDKKNNIKVNAEIIKKLNSGGDKLKGKRNYDIYITEFINMSRLIMMCNDCPNFTNEDALETCCEFNSTIQFKTQQEIDILIAKGENPLVMEKYKVGDADIKDKCRTDEWANAFVMLMVMNYQNFAVPCGSKQKITNNEKDEDEEEDNNDDCMKDLRKFIVTKFNITKNKNDFLKNEAIREVFDEEDFGDISSKKIANELLAIGLTNKKKSGARGWDGIKKREKKTETDENGNPLVK